MEADSVLPAGEAGGIENFLRADGIERVLRDIWLIGPMIWRKRARGDPRLAAEQVADEGFAIGGERQGLAHFAVREDGVFEIETEVVQVDARALGDGESGLAGEDGNHVRGQGTHLEVGG